ncbi:DNA polymerase III subunit gamma/tau [Clostridium botulinum]|uniref:DNA polymerase III subunit gamma/tau n=1 Tax=Clostridium botulinum TaxID=1491 RepID=UPI0004D63BF1|nr:DNA polymerase III subunit gamma/tau [Clostridium botulinum]KEI00793.1 DNA polymerase III subunit gamma/tau [Clostridium botulinum C/D str. BKT75002]KEI09711.1 DNA polymerase III subunit gamma/tau [Clostridium botulinum C/D str. BKT2873]KGM96983.1 DNA polymerase III subunit gamma/tau [Clostridium botulinum D str. CCUG 7971]KOC48925.1 DNA polymerase III subunit gamma/tau [Clostridium botulinum]MCD3351784.1 DNA polymerase III subunit gamma/tau [Clostridium botulinum D/C]
MGYTALYREWRPRTFEEVVGQEHITLTLKNQMKNNRIAHAYLFCGTRGTGKTSTAKIFSKAVNCLNPQDGEPCNQCDMCKKINAGLAIDVSEMDAASHNKVDDIRDLIEEVKYPPREGKYKVYIMDEAHMLTQGAVNAFLKTLEEPPENVVFILATTDPQKLPITILSRCQRFDFKRIKSDDILQRLIKITKEQGIFADNKSLSLIARMSDGAMRDALSILDQAISMGNGKVDYEQVINMLGLVTNDNLLKLTNAILDKDVENSIRIIDDVVYGGKDINLFIKDMIHHMRNLMMVKVSQSPEDVLDMSEENINFLKEQSTKIRIEEIMRCIRILQECEEQSKWSKQGRIYLELSIIKMCKIEYDTSKEVLLSRLNKLEKIIKEGNITINTKENNIRDKSSENKSMVKASSVKKQKLDIKEEVIEVNSNSKITVEDVKKSWKDILEIFKAKRHMVLYASLITGNVIQCRGGVITIKYQQQYAFNIKRLEKEDSRRIVEEIFSHELKEKVRIKYIVDKKEDKKSPEEILKEAFGEDLVEIIDE